MSFLQVDGQDAASYLSFDYNNRILLYNSGLDPTIHGELSLGIVLLVHIIQDAIERGREAFDFLRGNEEYKHRLGGIDTPVMQIHAQLN
jgi:CelD/BcsL family acetyltransferase involved in cellulose biosynthesis